MNNICNSYDTQKIYKLLHYKGVKLNDIDKYVFIGPQNETIKKILNKYEKEGSIGSSDKKRLNQVIPYYEKKIGEVVKHHTFFIYHYIDDNTNIEHLQENFCVFINEVNKVVTNKEQEHLLPSRQYLWYKAKNINLDYFINIINQIFMQSHSLSPKVFFEKIENILLLKLRNYICI